MDDLQQAGADARGEDVHAAQPLTGRQVRGWKNLPDAVLAAAGVSHDSRGNVRVPYRCRDGSEWNARIVTATNRRWWEHDFADCEGDPIPFGIDCLPPAAIAARSVLLIVEGESDALALRHAYPDYYVIALPGAGNWDPAWAAYATPFAHVYIIGDGDRAGECMNRRVLADIPGAVIVPMPAGRDARSILQNDGRERMDEQLAEADKAIIALEWGLTPLPQPNLAEVLPEVVSPRRRRSSSPSKSTNTFARASDLTPLPHDPRLRGDDLARHDADERLVSHVSHQAKLLFELDLRQEWRVGDAEVAVQWWLDDNGYYVLLVLADWPTTPAPKALKIAEVFAVTVTGELRKLNRPTMGRYKLRALIDAGIIPKPKPVPLIPLVNPTPQAQATWGAIGKLLAVRRLTEAPGEPIALSTPWLSNWSGVSEPVLRSGKRWLEKHGYIEHVGDGPGRPRPLKYWRVADADFWFERDKRRVAQGKGITVAGRQR
jgi:hypothetical protein